MHVPPYLSPSFMHAGHALYHMRLELQLWSSQRGQLLARTCNGMMRYEKALRVLCSMEYPKPGDMSEQAYEQ